MYKNFGERMNEQVQKRYVKETNFEFINSSNFKYNWK